MDEKRVPLTVKSCSKCGETQPYSEFHRRSDKPHLWKSHCRSCIRSNNSRYTRDNREQIMQQKRTYTENHRDQINAKAKSRRAEMTPQERQAYCDYLRQWRSDNGDKVKTYRQSTRAKRKQAFVEQVPFGTIWHRDDGVCRLCGKPLDRDVAFPDWESATLDHIIPLSKGGLHEKTNVQLACWRCNWLKRDY